MAQIVFGTVGATLGGRILGPLLGTLGRKIGRQAGRALGARIDAAVSGEGTRIVGPRMSELHVHSSSEGDPVPRAFGRVRLAAEVIWSTRLLEHRQRRKQSKGGPPKVEEFRYTVSFAVGLCEGVVARIERAWANGRPFDLSRTTHRFYSGDETQMPDPLIEAVEGLHGAPAYRGLSYVVFEDFALDEFGDTLPHFSFEVVCAPAELQPTSLEALARSVCMIPGSGEFALSTTPVRRRVGPGHEASENCHGNEEQTDFAGALDQLKADLPACETVVLVTSWFGTDLRCGVCAIQPGVERRDKSTQPIAWRVQGLSRVEAYLVTTIDGRPAYGGTPSDAAVIEAIHALKARGYKVVLYPFILMDIPAHNALPDPYGGAKQARYPWRGRITPFPAVGQPGAVDKTAAVAAQVSAFFGAALPSHFGVSNDAVTYAGPAEWSFRRFILHYAKLGVLAGGVDGFVMGSELRALTTARSSASEFPAVAALKALAADVKAIVGVQTRVTYAADWSEYFGHQPNDGSGDVYFHLDPLWADANIDAIGVDWYPPLSDWRSGVHSDTAIATSPHDHDYLTSRIEGGEHYDWFYATPSDRTSQVRTPIADGLGKPWVFRPKALRDWWLNAHYNRPGGVESTTPTAWIPQSKPIWFVELGCAAVDKGANAPNMFFDPKSSESNTPPFSTGARDDVMQRNTLEAYLRYWLLSSGHNPTSAVYGGPMIAPGDISLWAYDSRPFPWFPGLSDVWSDASAWPTGHWLNGRVGAGSLAALLKALCVRAGLAPSQIDVSAVKGAAAGCVLDSPLPTMDGLRPILAAHDLDMIEREGVLTFRPYTDLTAMVVPADRLIAPSRRRASLEDAPDWVRLRYLDVSRDYRFAVANARADGASARSVLVDVPLALDEEQAEAIAWRLLADYLASRVSITATTTPSLLMLEVGDRVGIEGEPGAYIVTRRNGADIEFVRAATRSGAIVQMPAATPVALADPEPTPELVAFSAPPLPGQEEDDRPMAAAFAFPWRGGRRVYAGADRAALLACGQIDDSAIMGRLRTPLPAGPEGRWDRCSVLEVDLFGGALESLSDSAVLNGANAFAVLTPAGGLEIVQAASCELVGPGHWRLQRLLRALQGTRCANPAPEGSVVVKLDERLARLEIGPDARRSQILVAAPRMGWPVTDPQAAVHAVRLDDLWARPFSPTHLRGWRAPDGEVTLRWVRRARIGGDPWEAGEPPLNEEREQYGVTILSAEGEIKRRFEVSAPSLVYALADQIADFGAPPSALKVQVAQWSLRYGFGEVRESILWL